MPQKIIIVRHGETQYNVDRRLQGWTDVPLNENGHHQAKKVAERLADEKIEAIYSSDHKRAHSTSQHIAAKHNLTPKKRKALREDMMGVLEGWQWETEVDLDKQRLWDERIKARENHNIHWKEHAGESLHEHTLRVQKLIREIEKKHPKGTIIIVSHGGTINRIMEICGFKNISHDYISYKNTSVTILTRQGSKYKLDLHNDTSHL